jgi:hypothetical protein
MQIRKDIQTAWNLLHVLEDDYQKIEYYRYKLYDKYDMKISRNVFMQIVSALTREDLVESKKGVGIRWVRGMKTAGFTEVMRALGTGFSHSPGSPAGLLQRRIFNLMLNERIEKC